MAADTWNLENYKAGHFEIFLGYAVGIQKENLCEGLELLEALLDDLVHREVVGQVLELLCFSLLQENSAQDFNHYWQKYHLEG